jgi:hypothetical protein
LRTVPTTIDQTTTQSGPYLTGELKVREHVPGHLQRQRIDPGCGVPTDTLAESFHDAHGVFEQRSADGRALLVGHRLIDGDRYHICHVVPTFRVDDHDRREGTVSRETVPSRPW